MAKYSNLDSNNPSLYSSILLSLIQHVILSHHILTIMIPMGSDTNMILLESANPLTIGQYSVLYQRTASQRTGPDVVQGSGPRAWKQIWTIQI